MCAAFDYHIFLFGVCVIVALLCAQEPWLSKDSEWAKEFAKRTGLTATQIGDWFSWRRATTNTGNDGVGDPGRVALAQAAQARAQLRADDARAAQARAQLQADDARRETEHVRELLHRQIEQQLAVEGELIELCAAGHGGAGWVALLPRQTTAQHLTAVQQSGSVTIHGHHGLLDTGNAARTMLNPTMCALAGIVAGPRTAQIRGVNGMSPRAS
jgi:hypothetical protein